MIMGSIYLVVASIVWGVVHSWTASHSFKRFVRRLVGISAYERLYRFSYNLFALASFFPILMMLMVLPDKTLYSVPSPWVYVMVIIQGIAAFALIAGVMQTGAFEFAGLRQLASGYDAKPASLVVDGLYSYVRHPLYSAGLVFIWFSPDMTQNRLVLWLIFSLYILIGAYFEERKLLIDFGEAYTTYKAHTPMLIPRLVRKS